MTIDVDLGFKWPFVDHGVWITSRTDTKFFIELVDTRKNNIVLARKNFSTVDLNEDEFIQHLSITVQSMAEHVRNSRRMEPFIDKYVGTFFGNGV